jgi:hypothetical protein
MIKTKNKYTSTHIGGLASYTIKQDAMFTATFFDNFFSGNLAVSKKVQLDIYNGLSSKRFLFLNKSINKMCSLSSRFFIATFFFFFKKITFKGKGFKLKKTKKKMFKFFFGSSHFISYYNKSFISKKFGKQKHIFLSTKLKKLKKGLLVFLTIKPISWYTKRGLRFTKQIVQRRAGKKSTH